MGWKRVAWTGCLVPVLGGCHGTDHATPDLAADIRTGHTDGAVLHRIRKDAREAWREVRAQYDRRAFTAEFHDGFLDGYADYLDRGGDAQPPAVPPPRYTRHQKYFTPEGHALIRDYFLGFKYGSDVAVATGQRQYLTVPVLVPEAVGSSAAGALVVLGPAAELPAAPLPSTPPAAPPTPRPLAGDRPPGLGIRSTPPKPSAAPAEPDLSKFSQPERGAATAPPGGGTAGLPAVPVFPVVADPRANDVPPLPRPNFTIRLPEPPSEVPALPPGAPVPPAAGESLPLPPVHAPLPPLPAVHPDPLPAPVKN